MNRRGFIAAIGIITVTAGCSDEGSSGSSSDTSGSGSGNGNKNRNNATTTRSTEPIDVSPEDLLLSMSDLDGSGWSADGTDMDGNTASNSFANFDSEENILSQVTVYDSKGDAESAYDSDYTQRSDSAATSNAVTVEDLGIGSESYLYQMDIVQVVVRDVNVLGWVRHSSFDGQGDRSTAIKYAQRMQQNWRS
jgi:hypothetical protein